MFVNQSFAAASGLRFWIMGNQNPQLITKMIYICIFLLPRIGPTKNNKQTACLDVMIIAQKICLGKSKASSQPGLGLDPYHVGPTCPSSLGANPHTQMVLQTLTNKLVGPTLMQLLRPTLPLVQKIIICLHKFHNIYQLCIQHLLNHFLISHLFYRFLIIYVLYIYVKHSQLICSRCPQQSQAKINV